MVYWDGYESRYDHPSTGADPSGPSQATDRVNRGGSCGGGPASHGPRTGATARRNTGATAWASASPEVGSPATTCCDCQAFPARSSESEEIGATFSPTKLHSTGHG